MDSTRTLMGVVVGLTPDVCPAYAMKYKLTRDVLEIYSARESNLLEPISGGWEHLTRRVVEGLRFFDSSYRRARAHFRRQEDERREAERKRVAISAQRGSRGRR